MRNSRIMAILTIFCFMVAGTTLLRAETQKKTVTFGKETVVVEYDSVKKKFTITDEKGKPLAYKPPNLGSGPVGELRIHQSGGPPQTIDNVTDGCEIRSHHNPYCYWRFIGGQYVYYCY